MIMLTRHELQLKRQRSLTCSLLWSARHPAAAARKPKLRCLLWQNKCNYKPVRVSGERRNSRAPSEQLFCSICTVLTAFCWITIYLRGLMSLCVLEYRVYGQLSCTAYSRLLIQQTIENQGFGNKGNKTAWDITNGAAQSDSSLNKPTKLQRQVQLGYHYSVLDLRFSRL